MTTQETTLLRDIALRTFGDDWWQVRENAMLTAARHDEVRVAFVGQFNAGKSTLVNALLGADVLPVGAVPTNSAVVEVRHGDERFAERHGDQASPLDRDAFLKLATQNSLDGARVDLGAWTPSPRLTNGIVFCDTPGVNAMDAQHASITYGFLPSCDAVVLVVDAQRGLVDADVRFLRDHILVHTRERLVVVATHFDLVPETQREGILATLRTTLATIGLAGAPIAGVGKGATDAAWDAITARVLAHRGAVRDERVARTRARIGAELVVSLEQHASRLGFDNAAYKAEIDGISRARDEVRRTREDLRARVRAEESRILGELAPRVSQLVLTLAANAPRYVAVAEDAGGGERVSAMVQGDLARAAESLSREWLAPRMEAALGELRQGLFELQTRLPELPVEGPAIGTTLGAGIDMLVEAGVLVLLNLLLPGAWLEALMARVLGQSLLESVTGPLKSAVKQMVTHLLGGFLRGQVERQLREAILGMEQEVLRSFEAQIRAILSQALDAGMKSLDDRLTELQRATEAARATRAAGDASVTAQRAAIARDVQTLRAAGMGT